jgi:hypothetical protein
MTSIRKQKNKRYNPPNTNTCRFLFVCLDRCIRNKNMSDVWFCSGGFRPPPLPSNPEDLHSSTRNEQDNNSSKMFVCKSLCAHRKMHWQCRSQHSIWCDMICHYSAAAAEGTQAKLKTPKGLACWHDNVTYLMLHISWQSCWSDHCLEDV